MTGKIVSIVQTRHKVFRIVPKCLKLSQNAHFRRIVVRMDLLQIKLRDAVAIKIVMKHSFRALRQESSQERK